MSVAVLNQSTVVSDADGQAMVTALNTLMPQFCRDWVLPTTTIVYVGRGRTSTLPLKVYIRDMSYLEGALGYHDQTSNVPYGVVFAKTILQYGVVLHSTTRPTVAQTLSHEVFELLVDINANLWASRADGSLYAYEVSDPVQSNAVVVRVQTGMTPARVGIPIRPPTPIFTTVTLSDWVLPRWFDDQETGGKFNHMNTIRKPFTLDRGGYAIVNNTGNVSLIFEQSVSAEKRARMLSKRHLVSRNARASS
jgi:hypothetical protein